MSHLQTVRSLAEDMNAIGLDAFDPHIAGLPLEEGKHADKVKADAEESGEEAEESEVEPYAPEVQEAAMTVFQAARPQIDESLIDYEESEFNYDFLNSIAALIESEIEDGADIDDAVQTVAEQVSSTYNSLTLVEDEEEVDPVSFVESLDEAELVRFARANDLDEADLEEVRKFILGKIKRVGRGIERMGITRKIKAGKKIVKKKVTGAMVMARKAAELARRGMKKLLNKKKGISARKGTAKISARKRARARRESVADELRNLLHEGVSAAQESTLSSLQFELAEAYFRTASVSALYAQFFEAFGDESDKAIVKVMLDVSESARQKAEGVQTIGESEVDIEESMGTLQTFAKVLSRTGEQYNEYALVDGEGNLVEMDDYDDDEDDDDTEESESGK